MSVRVPSADEAAALAELLNAHSQYAYGAEADMSEETMRSWFGLTDLELLVVDGPRGLAGYADFVPSSGGEHGSVDLRALPEDVGLAAPALLEAFEARARELGKTRLRTFVAAGDDAMRAEVERRGYRVIRHSFRMLVELDGRPEAPPFPDGIEARRMQPGEEPAVHAAQMAAFADHWGHHPISYASWRSWDLDRDGSRPDLWWLAVDGEEIAGLCLNRMADSGEPDHGYVHILGVLPAWRQRGLGEALLRHSFVDLYDHGCRRVSLDVDGENPTGAVRLYERVGMHVERRLDTYERELDG